MTPADLIPADIHKLYRVQDHKHAATILALDYREEFEDLCTALRSFRFTDEWVMKAGGNESELPRAFATLLRPDEKNPRWTVEQLNASLTVGDKIVSTDTHKVDFVRGRVACDFEWNSKDQTFDRDLAAFRAFFDFDRIAVGVLVTRDTDSMNAYFKALGNRVDRYGTTRTVLSKYGASTTHMEQLSWRLSGGRAGGCPVLALGITPNLRKV